MKLGKDKTNTYEPDKPGKANVRVGTDDDSEFGPEVRIGKFHDRAWLRIMHPDAKVKDKAKQKAKDGKVEVSKGDKKRLHRFFEVPE